MNIVVETKEGPENKALRGLSRDFDLVEDIIDNPSALQSYKHFEKPELTDSYEYVIITDIYLKNSDEEYTFQDLIDSKIADGISAKINIM